MNPNLKNQFQRALNHLYINPLEKCNLRCAICYTRKTDDILSEKEILKFIQSYQKVHTLQSITFCGGEVMTLSYFPALVNSLNAKGLIIQIITNGTIDRLTEFNNPNLINMIISLDGLGNYHDQNRGKDMFKKSLDFLSKAQNNGFHTEVFSVVTKQNFTEIEKFESFLTLSLVQPVSVTYHPRKSINYLLNHPTSNVKGKVDGFDFLTTEQMTWLFQNKKTFPPHHLGCFQVSLMSDGKIYGCCEGTVPIGKITDEISSVFQNLKTQLKLWEKESANQNCLGCVYPDFVCGIRDYISF
jgi:MoaA/NifB/PqqE/SkfB family radical SAM enzyme